MRRVICRIKSDLETRQGASGPGPGDASRPGTADGGGKKKKKAKVMRVGILIKSMSINLSMLNTYTILNVNLLRF